MSFAHKKMKKTLILPQNHWQLYRKIGKVIFSLWMDPNSNTLHYAQSSDNAKTWKNKCCIGEWNELGTIHMEMSTDTKCCISFTNYPFALATKEFNETEFTFQ
jgi:hypothetical protein